MTRTVLDIPVFPPLESYPRLPYRGEDGIRAVVRREPCACGESAVQLSGELVEDAVARHNATPGHVLWRSARESSRTPAGPPTAGPGRVDVSAATPVRPGACARPGRAL